MTKDSAKEHGQGAPASPSRATGKSKDKHLLEPAARIIRALGGSTAIAKALSLHRTRVASWQRARAAGGTSGLIPQKHHPALLALAREKGIALAASDFLPTTFPEDAQ